MRAASLGVSAFLAMVLFAGCPASQTEEVGPDAAVEVRDLQPALYPVGPFEDCTPTVTGFSDARCKEGLRCSVVEIDVEGGGKAALSQCVPVSAASLKEGEACAYDQEAGPQVAPRRRFDRCGDGMACIPAVDGAFRCRRMCGLRVHGACKKDEACVLPAQVMGIGFCAKPDKCKPATMPSGCGKGADGKEAGCYVLGDDKVTDSFCWSKQPYGAGASGGIDSACDRSFNCDPGLSCIAKSSGKEPTCRPYCERPVVPDGGAADLGVIPCSGDLGVCYEIKGYESTGRCL